MIKATTTRSANQVSGETTDKLESLDGQRRAHGRYVKKSIGNHRWEPVLAFTLREKIDGKFKVVGSGYSRDYAESWINKVEKQK